VECNLSMKFKNLSLPDIRLHKVFLRFDVKNPVLKVVQHLKYVLCFNGLYILHLFCRLSVLNLQPLFSAIFFCNKLIFQIRIFKYEVFTFKHLLKYKRLQQ
jgi:hypothetical protein